MSRPLRILFLAAEAAPFAKTGGLGDVVGSLPKALAAMGHDVRVAIPAYAPVEAAVGTGRWGLRAHGGELRVPVGGGTIRAGVLEGRLPGSDVPVYFIAERNLFARTDIYGYDDDPWRFSFFSRGGLELVPALGWKPDVVHAHDWHASPAIAWIAHHAWRDSRFGGIPTVLTLHNLAHQGRAPWAVMDYLDIRSGALHEEPYGSVNLLARGIFHAVMINTVSPTYAREILTPEGGQGLDGLLRHRQRDVHGILNGLDEREWDPAADPRLAATFDAEGLERRRENKRALQDRLGLERRDVPLVGMVSRLDAQKGLDIVGHVVHRLLNAEAGEAQFVVLGSGAARYEDMFRHICGYHQGRAAAYLGYQADLAPLIYGGSDLFLMPSLFEPCGLGQLIAMRYGSVPVVRAVGGLADTVHDGVTGFVFNEFSADALWDALARAIYVRSVDAESWAEIQRRGMGQDFSWRQSALGYQQLYTWALARIGR